MKSVAIVLLLISNTFVCAQSVSTLMGARAAGMGYASASLSDETALLNNIGAMGTNNKTSSFFSYELQPNLPGANRTAGAFTGATRYGSFGIGMFRFGDELYNEQIATAGFSNKFGITSLGARVNYIQYHIEGYANENAVSVDFGGLTQITSRIVIGAYITNLSQARISDAESLPTKLTVGLGLRPSNQLFVSTEVEKDLAYPARWKTGVEYSVNKKIYVRTGFNLNPNAGFFGLGFVTHRLKIDYALKFNAALGTAHQSSAIYVFEKRNKT